ncbi:MAG: glutamate synthase, partial [Pseudomonadota bacterium]
AHRLNNFFQASVELMQVLARACGHRRLADFELDDLTTFKPEMSALSGIAFAGVKA